MGDRDKKDLKGARALAETMEPTDPPADDEGDAAEGEGVIIHGGGDNESPEGEEGEE